MQKEEIQARAGKIQWFHNYELLPGVMTQGLNPTTTEETRGNFLQIPQDLCGKRVLDVGCADGYFTFLAEARGASVVAIDSWPYQGFLLAHEVRGSKAEFRQMNVYDLQPDILGPFDIVFFTGIYYHLKHPILALERIASVTRELAIIESQIMNLPGFEDTALSRFYEPEELASGDPTNRWVPNVPCLLQTVRAAGFPRVEFIGSYANGSRGVVHAYKGPRTAAKILNEDFICLIHTPSANTVVSGTIQVTGVAFSKVAGANGIERVTVYLDKLDDPASELGQATYPTKDGSWRESVAARLAGDRFGPISFEFSLNTAEITPGQHMLYILAEGQRGWHYSCQPIVVKDSSTQKFSGQIFGLEPEERNKSTQPKTNTELSASTSLSRQNQLLVEIDRLGQSVNVSSSTQPGWPLVDNVRRAFHNLVIYYVNILAHKQQGFNHAITSLLKQIVALQEKIEPEVEMLQTEVATLRSEIQALQAKFEKQVTDEHNT